MCINAGNVVVVFVVVFVDDDDDDDDDDVAIHIQLLQLLAPVCYLPSVPYATLTC